MLHLPHNTTSTSTTAAAANTAATPPHRGSKSAATLTAPCAYGIDSNFGHEGIYILVHRRAGCRAWMGTKAMVPSDAWRSGVGQGASFMMPVGVGVDMRAGARLGAPPPWRIGLRWTPEARARWGWWG